MRKTAHHIYSPEIINWLKLNYPLYGGRYCRDYMGISSKELAYLKSKFALSRQEYIIDENIHAQSSAKLTSEIKVPNKNAIDEDIRFCCSYLNNSTF